MENGNRPRGGIKKIEEGVPSIGGEHLNADGGFNLGNVKLIPEDFYRSLKRGKIKKRDVLVVKDGATTGKTSYVGMDFPYQESAVNEHVFILRGRDELIDQKFLFYHMFSSLGQRQIKASFHGSAVGGINTQFVKRYSLLLPPIDTQKKIVSILEKAEQLKQWRKESDKLTANYLDSIFLEMFGDPIHNKKGWARIQGKDLFQFSSGKSNPTRNMNNNYPYPAYGGNGITGLSKEYLIDYDTIIIGRVGAYCGSIHISKGKSWITDNAIYIKKFKREINLMYLYYLLRFLNLHRFAYYSGQPKITQKPLEELHYMFPPIEMQNDFAQRVNKIVQIKKIQKQSKRKIDELYNYLMQKAFRGELAC